MVLGIPILQHLKYCKSVGMCQPNYLTQPLGMEAFDTGTSARHVLGLYRQKNRSPGYSKALWQLELQTRRIESLSILFFSSSQSTIKSMLFLIILLVLIRHFIPTVAVY